VLVTLEPGVGMRGARVGLGAAVLVIGLVAAVPTGAAAAAGPARALPPEATVGAAAAMSPDGRYIVYNLFTDGPVDAAGYLRDLQTGTVVRLPGFTLDFSSAAFSADDGLLAYQHHATHGSAEVVYNIAAGEDEVYLASFEREWYLPFIGSAGRYVAYSVMTDPIVHGPTAAYRYDLSTRRSERVGGDAAGWLGGADGISGDGHLVLRATSQPLLPADTNGTADIYSRDTRTGQTVLVSATPTGHAGNNGPAATALTPDGRYLLFVRDLRTGRTQRVDLSSDGVQARFSARPVALSADGRYALFTSTAGNLDASRTQGT
jgi:Tol biopolymer transport system component